MLSLRRSGGRTCVTVWPATACCPAAGGQALHSAWPPLACQTQGHDHHPCAIRAAAQAGRCHGRQHERCGQRLQRGLAGRRQQQPGGEQSQSGPHHACHPNERVAGGGSACGCIRKAPERDERKHGGRGGSAAAACWLGRCSQGGEAGTGLGQQVAGLSAVQGAAGLTQSQAASSANP